MTRYILICIATISLWLTCVEVQAAATEKWTMVQSKNFTLVGNASEGDIRDVANKLEQYRRILSGLFKKAELRKTVPTTVIVFKNDEAFRPFGPVYRGKVTEVAGYFQPGRDLNYIAVSAERKKNNSFGTIFHEFVHLFLENNLQGLPLCFNEGVAEYYGALNASGDGKKIILGNVSLQRMRLLNEKELLPLKTLLATDYDSQFYNQGDQRSLFYAQSWALVHYLIHRHEEKGLEQFEYLVRLISEGSTIDDGLKQSFGLRIDEIEAGLKTYVRSPPFPTRVVTVDQDLPVEKVSRGAPVSIAQARAYLGDLLLHLGRLEESERYLQDALTLDSGLTSAQASLGMLRVKQGRIEDAVKILRSAAAIDSRNYLTQYYFAYALSREEMVDEETVWGYMSSRAEEMRVALNRAIELAPHFIEAYRLQAFVNLARNEQLDKAETMLNQALELSAGRQDLLLILAQVHIRKLNFEAAREDLRPVIKRPSEPKFRDQANTLLEDIKYTESQAARLENLVRKNPEAATDNELKSEASFQQQAHAAKQKLLKRFKGERVLGFLTGIDCLAKGIAVSVKAGDRTLRLHAPELRSIFFVAYVTGLERTVTCGARTTQNLVVLTYRASNDPRGGFDGEAIAIEFVPEDIDIEP